jgi:hypothetical protein
MARTSSLDVNAKWSSSTGRKDVALHTPFYRKLRKVSYLTSVRDSGMNFNGLLVAGQIRKTEEVQSHYRGG